VGCEQLSLGEESFTTGFTLRCHQNFISRLLMEELYMSNHFKNKKTKVGGNGLERLKLVLFPNTGSELPYFKWITACVFRVKMKYCHENVRTKERRKKWFVPHRWVHKLHKTLQVPICFKRLSNSRCKVRLGVVRIVHRKRRGTTYICFNTEHGANILFHKTGIGLQDNTAS
jgi:hypothetical protein